jgi:quercetin dioxygenase-like cupin family protein
MHVDAGGQIAVHEAAVDQLFIVVAGSGEVSGDDEVWRPIRAGQAAFWLAGEKHGTRAADGLTSVVVEMTSMPLAP